MAAARRRAPSTWSAVRCPTLAAHPPPHPPTPPHPTAGPARETKKALEAYWSGKADGAALLEATATVEAAAWRAQADAGIELIGLDGTLYDQCLDAIWQLGLLPPRFQVCCCC